jgi:hypothetical protein
LCRSAFLARRESQSHSQMVRSQCDCLCIVACIEFGHNF